MAASSKLDAPPERINEALRFTASSLDIGHRYDEVKIFVTPGPANPPNDGFAVGNEAWVTSSFYEDSSVQYTRIFLHEYIHTRQAFGGASLEEMVWFNEGMAEYYSYKMMLDAGLMSPERYNRWLRNGSTMSGVLTDPETWADSYVPYGRGGAYFAILGAKIQASSNHSLATVVREINTQGDPRVNKLVQPHTFLERVAAVSNESTVAWATESLLTSDDFEYHVATAPPSNAYEPLKIKVTRSLDEQPFMAVAAAFVIGMYFTLFLYTLFNRRSN